MTIGYIPSRIARRRYCVRAKIADPAGIQRRFKRFIEVIGITKIVYKINDRDHPIASRAFGKFFNDTLCNFDLFTVWMKSRPIKGAAAHTPNNPLTVGPTDKPDQR